MEAIGVERSSEVLGAAEQPSRPSLDGRVVVGGGVVVEEGVLGRQGEPGGVKGMVDEVGDDELRGGDKVL